MLKQKLQRPSDEHVRLINCYKTKSLAAVKCSTVKLKIALSKKLIRKNEHAHSQKNAVSQCRNLFVVMVRTFGYSRPLDYRDQRNVLQTMSYSLLHSALESFCVCFTSGTGNHKVKFFKRNETKTAANSS